MIGSRGRLPSWIGFFGIGALFSCLWGILGLAGPVVSMGPGDNLQDIVDKNPAGTRFSLKSGTYRLQQIRPKDGDSFVGEGPSTILSGAVVLTRFQKSGDLFSTQYAPQGTVHGDCTKDAPLCNHTVDCFLDNIPLRRVGTQAEVKKGAWFMDTARHAIVLGDDPAGHLVEVSTTRNAFSGPAANVTITGLTVEKYAVPAQNGAIGDQSPGPHWEVSQCLVRWNHGAGIMVADGSVVRDNRVIQNGQLGIACHGKGVLIDGNEIASNNYASFDAGWEAGGTKFSRTDGLKVTKNNVHDNLGPGLWTDIDNKDTVYDGNTVLNNGGEGIKHEISFAAQVHGNTVSGNGRFSVWLWGSQILIQNSSGVDVSGNQVTVPAGYGNGIGVILQNRGTWVARDNRIHDNDITYLDPRQGATGVACDYEAQCGLVQTNHFDSNHYHVSDLGRSHWFWRRAVKWEDFQGEPGQEPHGTVDVTSRPSK